MQYYPLLKTPRIQYHFQCGVYVAIFVDRAFHMEAVWRRETLFQCSSNLCKPKRMLLDGKKIKFSLKKEMNLPNKDQ